MPTSSLKYVAHDVIRPMDVDKQARSTMTARMTAPTLPKRIIALLERTGAPVSWIPKAATLSAPILAMKM